MSRIPVIALTGHLGAGKTTLLNHVLGAPGARIGVIVNDFGDVNVDAALVSGQIDEPAAISGGCLCCLVDDDSLDEALAKLARPRLGLDAIIVEASGVAEPGVLASMIAFTGAEHVRPGGLVDVVDAVEYFDTVDGGGVAPARFAAATLVVINKCDLLPEQTREQTLARIEARIHEANPSVHVVRTNGGRIDPALLFDVASADDPPDQLPFAAAERAARPHHHHTHAAAVTVASPDPVDPGALLDLLEEPPPGAYRMKGRIAVHSAGGPRGYLVNLVGRTLHIVSHPVQQDSELVAIGLHLDTDTARQRLTAALAPAERANPAGLRRLQRYRRASL